MAVARIFTRHPEAATSLSEELRRQGYSVEIVVQDQPPARKDQDVEIDLEFLRHAESPTYSDEIITEFAPDAVAPAAAPKPLTLAGTQPQMIDVPIEAPEVESPEVQAYDAVQSPVQMPAMPPVAILDEPEHFYLQEVEQLEELARVFGPQAETSPEPQSTRLTLLATIENLAHRVAHVCREQINLRTARIREARHQRQLALEARHVREQERAAELETAREAAAERLQLLLRERGDELPKPVLEENQDIALEEIESEAALVGAAEEPARPPVVRAPIAAFQPPLWRQLLFKPEYAFAGVAALGSLVVVGLALTSFHPKVNTKPDQPAVAAPAQNSAAGIVAPASQSVKEARPGAARNRRGKSVLVSGNGITTRHLGRDVTIRQYPQGNVTPGFTTQAKPAAHNREQPELRRISDLEN